MPNATAPATTIEAKATHTHRKMRFWESSDMGSGAVPNMSGL